MARDHTYEVEVSWTGNLGSGTSNYQAYARDHVVKKKEGPPLPGSSDPTFRGDRERYNPEELLLASLSACHMLWYLHLCAENGVNVTSYVDSAVGRMEEDGDAGGHFTGATLTPIVTITPGSDPLIAEELHQGAHHRCFISRSVNFPVEVEPVLEIGSEPDSSDVLASR